MVVLPGSGSGWVSILGMLRLLFHPTGMCKMPGQGVLGGLAKSLEKLSSGFRINRAADDAAGLAISEGLRSQVGGNRQAVRNAQDGISVIQTAEGALNEVHSILQRMRTLAVQGANDTNDTKSRSNIRAELVQLRDELNRIGKVTNFNGTKLLNGDASGAKALKFQVGANGTKDDRIVVDLKDADVTKISKFGGNMDVSNVKSATSAAIGKNKYVFDIEGKQLVMDFANNAAAPTDKEISAALGKAIKDTGFDGYVGEAATNVSSEAVALVTATDDLKGSVFTLQIGEKSVNWTADEGTGFKRVADQLQAQLTEKGLDKDYRISFDGQSNKFKVETLNENSPQVDVKLSVNTDKIKVGTGTTGTNNLLTDKLGTPTGNGIHFSVKNKLITMERVDGKNINIDLEHSLSEVAAGAAPKDVAWTVKKAAATLPDGSAAGDYIKKDLDLLSVEDHDSAQALINLLDDKINSVSTARANLGAIQNRFEHTITNLNVAVENLAASESRIRDTDMAQEMMQFTRNQI
ncbi:flagellin, partial [Mobiluncus mulieris]|uniref:flagellin N-terminal helical domain-containing protein n=1 Tax=Mobiluncus mulieris TaxID=2052 RepID=UPI0005627EAE